MTLDGTGKHSMRKAAENVFQAVTLKREILSRAKNRAIGAYRERQQRNLRVRGVA